MPATTLDNHRDTWEYVDMLILHATLRSRRRTYGIVSYYVRPEGFDARFNVRRSYL